MAENPATWDALTKDLSNWIAEWEAAQAREVCGFTLGKFLRERLVEARYVLVFNDGEL